MKFKGKKNFFYAEKGIERYIITDKKICFIGWEFTKEETVEFLKQHGHKPISKIHMIKMIGNANQEIEKYEDELYEDWEEYIDMQEKEGYNTVGNFFGNYQDYYKVYNI